MIVLDASALVALLFGEPGFEVVSEELSGGGVLSSVNAAEVLSLLAGRGLRPEEELGRWETSGLLGLLDIVSLDLGDAIEIANLRVPTRSLGLSLGDRACLALAKRLGLPAVTADRTWEEVADQLGIAVRLIR